MNKEELHRAIVQKIDTNLNNTSEATGSIIECLIEIRACINEILFLKNFINDKLND